MPEIIIIKERHCVTRGQIIDRIESTLTDYCLEEIKVIFGTKRITRKCTGETGLQIGPVFMKKGLSSVESAEVLVSEACCCALLLHAHG